jgi:4a-hydroxytetrahydrobiopterin dehydratase
VAGMLDDKQVKKDLESLNGEWSVIDTRLERVFEFPNFKTGLDFVNKIGAIAEKENHHPDIQLGWGKVVISLTTHSAVGLTDKDFELARKIDAL